MPLCTQTRHRNTAAGQLCAEPPEKSTARLNLVMGTKSRITFMISSAYTKNAAVILTEDLNEGQQIEGITIVNPFH